MGHTYIRVTLRSVTGSVLIFVTYVCFVINIYCVRSDKYIFIIVKIKCVNSDRISNICDKVNFTTNYTHLQHLA